jgi:hypothetical protein
MILKKKLQNITSKITEKFKVYKFEIPNKKGLLRRFCEFFLDFRIFCEILSKHFAIISKFEKFP